MKPCDTGDTGTCLRISEMLAGHCVQPDMFGLQVNGAVRSPVAEPSGEGGDAG